MKKYLLIGLGIVALAAISWWYFKPTHIFGVSFNTTYTENLAPFTNNLNLIGNSSTRYKGGFINNATSSTIYTDTLSVGSSSPGNALTAGKALASDSGGVGCIGGCAWYPMIGAEVEGISFIGGEGGHFKSTEVAPTPSMECFIAMGDVYPDGHGLKCTYSGLTATILDTYSVSPKRSPSWGSFTGPGSFGFGTSTADSLVSFVSQSISTTTITIKPLLAQTANILNIYDTITNLNPTDVITGWDGISHTNYWGLATSTPWQKLSVNGNMVLTGSFYDSLASPGTSGQSLISTVSGTKWSSCSTPFMGAGGNKAAGASYDFWEWPGQLSSAAMLTTSFVASSTYVIYWTEPCQPVTFTGISIRVTANVAGSNIRCGVYATTNAGGNLYAANVVLGPFIFDSSSTGVKMASTTWTPTPGTTYATGCYSTSTPSMAVPNNNSLQNVLGTDVGANAVNVSMSTTTGVGTVTAYYDLPDPFPAAAIMRSVIVPTFFLQRSN